MERHLRRFYRYWRPVIWTVSALIALHIPMMIIVLTILPEFSLRALRGIFFAASDDVDEFILTFTLMCLMFFGFSRATFTHPFWDDGYFNWLRSTPYSGQEKLPLGPVRLTIRDVLNLAVMLAIIAACQIEFVPCALSFFLLSYYVPLLLVSRAMKDLVLSHAMAYILILSFAGIFSIWQSVMLVLMFPVVILAINRSVTTAMRDMPLVDIQNPLAASSFSTVARSMSVLGMGLIMLRMISGNAHTRPSIGWPCDALSPIDPQPTHSRAERLSASLLMALIFFVVCWHNPPESVAKNAPVLGSFLIGALAIIRLVRYRKICNPPISILGRIARLTPVIPAYDVVYVAPILTVLLALLTPRLLMSAGIPPALAMGAAVFLFSAVAMLGGPSLRAWTLTAPARLTQMSLPESRQNSEETRIRLNATVTTLKQI